MEKPAENKHESESIDILLIEDNPGDVKLVEMMLMQPETSSYRLKTVNSLNEAHELIEQRHNFKVALLDMSLPDGEGIDNILQLKSWCSDLPIVILSGRDDDQFALDAVRAGAQDYLIKGRIDEWQLSRALNYSIERKRLEEELSFMAHHDQLTGLANRTLFYSRLEHAIDCAERRNESIAVMYLDLDHFKAINDALGHEMGDKLLQEVAERLSNNVRGADTIARLGGDEFALVLEGLKSTNNASAVAEKIIESLSKPINIKNQMLYVGTSIGIAFYPDCGKDLETLIKNADRAMYQAKKNGRNQYKFYTKTMNVNALSQLTMEMQLREALNNDEFELHYQPKINLKTGEISGNEALLRWNNNKETVYPKKIIPLLEQNGMISEVGKWVLETACKQHVVWLNHGLPFGKIAVNLSGHQLLERDFTKSLSNILDKTGLKPNQLEVELTESLLINNTNTIMEVMEVLKSMGVSIAIDDFGTGYSSFSYLKRFLIDTIKIDHSFVKDIYKNKTEAAITSAVIKLAKELDIKVIAEGVETEEELNFFKELEVDEIQVFYFNRPMTAMMLTDKFQHRRAS